MPGSLIRGKFSQVLCLSVFSHAVKTLGRDDFRVTCRILPQFPPGIEHLRPRCNRSVSYTHLTLPTILLV